jgi:hypothetical protein
MVPDLCHVVFPLRTAWRRTKTRKYDNQHFVVLSLRGAQEQKHDNTTNFVYLSSFPIFAWRPLERKYDIVQICHHKY